MRRLRSLATSLLFLVLAVAAVAAFSPETLVELVRAGRTAGFGPGADPADGAGRGTVPGPGAPEPWPGFSIGRHGSARR